MLLQLWGKNELFRLKTMRKKKKSANFGKKQTQMVMPNESTN
ncbi:transcriptional regulator [Listeria monocytogenes]|nr:transcriptional regulator [Listeria monocytogenes]